MRKIKINLPIMAISLLLTVGLLSCGGKKKQESLDRIAELSPYKTEVNGYLSSNLEVIQGNYKYDYKSNFMSGESIIQIKLKSIAKGNTSDYGLNDGNGGPLYLTICNKDGMPLSDFSDIASSHKADGLLKGMLNTIGEEQWIAFTSFPKSSTGLPEEATHFFITSKQIVERDSRSSTSSSSAISSSSEWDKALDDYENYMDKYLKLLEKGDDLDMFDSMDLYEEASKLEKSLNKAHKDKALSKEQIRRLNKINLKFVKKSDDFEF